MNLAGIISLLASLSHAEFVNKAAAQFKNAPLEPNVFHDPHCTVTGDIPSYLSGSLYRIGAGYWDPKLNYVKNDTHSHLFFGLSIIHVFHFEGEKIEYRGVFQESGVSEKYFTGNTENPLSTNTVVTIRRFLDENNEYVYLSSTEITASNSFDPVDLSTKDKPYIYKDVKDISELPWKSWAIQNGPSHAQIDLDGTIYNYIHYPCKRFVGFCVSADYYKMYYISPGTNERIFPGSDISSNAYNDFTKNHNGYLANNALFIQHSLGLTENYMIIIEIPFMQKMDLGIIDLITQNIKFDLLWVGDEYQLAHWYVINKKTGELYRSYISDAFMTFHVANAYEKDGNIVIDMIETLKTVYDAFFIENIKHGEISDETGKLIRWVLPLNTNNIKIERIMELSNKNCLAFPMYSYFNYNTKPYEYVYSLSGYSCNYDTTEKSGWTDMLVKQKIPIYPHTTHYEALIFREEYQFYSEPTFVPNPNGIEEDDGLVLSVSLDGNTNTTYLLILDAKNFNEVARVQPNIGVAIPYTFHGRYYDNI
eukprot:221304_1